jgi:hypothetical protein
MPSALEGSGLADPFAHETPERALAVLAERLTLLPMPERRAPCVEILDVLEAQAAKKESSPLAFARAILIGGPALLRASGQPRAFEARLRRILAENFSAAAPAERGVCLGAEIGGLADLSLPCALFVATANNPTADMRDEGDEPFFGAATEALSAELLGRVTGLADEGRFWSQVLPGALLWFWFTFGEEQRVYAFTKQAMRQDDALAALMEAVLDSETVPAGTVEVVAVRRWSKLIDLHGLEQRALTLALSAPTRGERARARRFLEAYATGKSDLFR